MIIRASRYATGKQTKSSSASYTQTLGFLVTNTAICLRTSVVQKYRADLATNSAKSPSMNAKFPLQCYIWFSPQACVGRSPNDKRAANCLRLEERQGNRGATNFTPGSSGWSVSGWGSCYTTLSYQPDKRTFIRYQPRYANNEILT